MVEMISVLRTGSGASTGLIMLSITLAELLIGLYGIAKYRKYSDDKKIDEICDDMLKVYEMEKVCELNNENKVMKSEPATIKKFCSSKYIFDNIFLNKLVKKGKDNLWRSSNIEMQVLLVAGNKAYYYNKKQSLISSEEKEQRGTFFISDIVFAGVMNENGNDYLRIGVMGLDDICIPFTDKNSGLNFLKEIESIKKNGYIEKNKE